MGLCDNCRKEVEVNFDLHTIHCLKHLRLCPKCDEPFPRDSILEHIENDHKRVICSNGCGESFEKFYEQKHLLDECKNRLRQCVYCEIETTIANIFEHEDSCGSRTELCPYCDKYIVIKNFAEHEKIHIDWITTKNENKDRVSNPIKLTRPDNGESTLQESVKDLTKSKAPSNNLRSSVNSSNAVPSVKTTQSNEKKTDPYNTVAEPKNRPPLPHSNERNSSNDNIKNIKDIKAITQSKVAGINKSNLFEHSRAQTSTNIEPNEVIRDLSKNRELIFPEKIRGGAKFCRGIDAMDSYPSLVNPGGKKFMTPGKSDESVSEALMNKNMNPHEQMEGRFSCRSSFEKNFEPKSPLTAKIDEEKRFGAQDERIISHISNDNEDKDAELRERLKAFFSSSSYGQSQNSRKNEPNEREFMIRNNSDSFISEVSKNIRDKEEEQYFSYSSYEETECSKRDEPTPTLYAKDYRVEKTANYLANKAVKTCNLDKEGIKRGCRVKADLPSTSRSIFDVESKFLEEEENDELTMILSALDMPVYRGMSKVEKDNLMAKLLSEQELVEFSKKKKNSDPTLKVSTRPWLEGGQSRTKSFGEPPETEKRIESISYEDNLSEAQQKNVPVKRLNGIVLREEAYNGVLDSEDDNISEIDQSEFSSSSDEGNSPIPVGYGKRMKDNTRRDADPTTNKDVQGKFTGGSEGSGWVEAETMVRHAISRMNSERDKPVKIIADRDAYSPDPWNRKKFIDCEKCVKKIPANNYITHLAMCPGPKPPKRTRPKRNASPTFGFMPHRNKWLEDNKPLPCPHCNTLVLSNNIFTHSAICRKEKKVVEERKVSCKHCGELIISKNIESHQETCKHMVAKNSDPTEEVVPCEFCQELVEFSRIESHEVFCSSSFESTRGKGRGRRPEIRGSTKPRYPIKTGSTRDWDENDSYETVGVRRPFGGRHPPGLGQQRRPPTPSRGSFKYGENGGYETADTPDPFGSRQPSGHGQQSRLASPSPYSAKNDGNDGYETADTPHSFGSRLPQGPGRQWRPAPPGRGSMSRNNDMTGRHRQTGQYQCPQNNERENSSSVRGRGEGTRYGNRRGRRGSPSKTSLYPQRYY
ncbi:uncharacterized protein LOC136026197 isoform X2 [Artemia franciscana]|uniref:uncharacterized protein LOC136026197 isoform X2 n=1 Tax=Artemia franciscana TaxID=6661 RepID=UPI0032DA7BF0